MTEHDRDAEFRDLLDRAAKLPKSIEPPRDLWPGIETRIAGTLPGRRETGHGRRGSGAQPRSFGESLALRTTTRTSITAHASGTPPG